MSERLEELRALSEKIRRHWRWGRAQGFRRLIEEDELDPLVRASNRLRRWRWRRTHPVRTGSAMPVYLVGAQRSGTNMVVRGLQGCPEFEVYNENNDRAFDSFRLRSDATIASIILSSRHRYVLFKPLIDSYRVDALLDDLHVDTPGRALWVYRNVDDRVRSSLAKFGDTNLRALADIARGVADRWEAEGLSREKLKVIRSFDYRSMSPASGSALFWFLRNSLYLELHLDRRRDVLLVSYDAFVHDPISEMRAVCRFLDFPWQASLVSDVRKRTRAPERLPLEPRIRELCDDLQLRLDTAHLRSAGALVARA
jgi:hypothetical protein